MTKYLKPTDGDIKISSKIFGSEVLQYLNNYHPNVLICRTVDVCSEKVQP